jgi:hypothetical protein
MTLSMRALELLAHMFSEQSQIQLPLSHLTPALEIRTALMRELEARRADPS